MDAQQTSGSKEAVWSDRRTLRGADLESLSPDAAEWRKLAAGVLRDCR